MESVPFFTWNVSGNRSSTHCRAAGSGNSEAERMPKNLDASKLRGLVTLARKEDEAEGIEEAFTIVDSGRLHRLRFLLSYSYNGTK